jgi:hypothetical protein
MTVIAVLVCLAVSQHRAWADDNGQGGGAAAGDSGASGGAAGSDNSSPDADPGTAATIRQNYFKRFKWAKEFNDNDQVNDGKSQENGTVSVPGPLYVWPKHVNEGGSVQVPTQRDTAIGKHLVKTFGYPVSDTQFQIIQRLDDNMMLEEAFDPERRMWMESAMGAIKATSAANSIANMGRNQGAGAITFAQTFLRNFTTESNNVWQRIRSELFIPMAFLLLLPGAVLAQVRAIIAQGMPVMGEVNPFEGIIRAIIAIFFIPATYLVISWGIDLSNSIAWEINAGYARIAHGDMYNDAICAQKRAFPIRKDKQNKNAIPTQGISSSLAAAASGGISSSLAAAATGQDVFAGVESLSFDVGAGDPCSQSGGQGGSQSGGTTGSSSDESSSVLQSTQRLVVNGANAGLTATWNVLCAFQMAYLYYLWCMGPIVAALWVWPIGQLRGSLASWAEGVVTLCFWSLFWNTTILLMACFKGVGDTGTIMMTALNFLAVNCVKYAFDFSGLIKAAGQQAGQAASKGAGGKGGGGGGGHGGGGQGAAQGAPGAAHSAPGGVAPASAHGPAPAHAGSGGERHAHAGSLASAMSTGGPSGTGGHASAGLSAGQTLAGGQHGEAHSQGGVPGSSNSGGAGAGHVSRGGSDVAGAGHGSSEPGGLPPLSSDGISSGGANAGGASLGLSESAMSGASGQGAADSATYGSSIDGIASQFGSSAAGSLDALGHSSAGSGQSAGFPGADALSGQSAASAAQAGATFDGGAAYDVSSSSGGSSFGTQGGALLGQSGPGATGSGLPPGIDAAAGAQLPPGLAGLSPGSGLPPGVDAAAGAQLPPGLGGLPPGAGLPPGVDATAGAALPPAAGMPPGSSVPASYYLDVSTQAVETPPPAASDPGYTSSPQYYREEEADSQEYFALPPKPEPSPQAVQSDQDNPWGGSADGPRTLSTALGKAGSPRGGSTPDAAGQQERKSGSLSDYFRKSGSGSGRKISRDTKEWKARSLEELERIAKKDEAE